MGGLGEALQPTSYQDQQGPRKKTAEEFLGANANLVNLDNLVSKPSGAGNTTSFSLLDDFSQTSGHQDSLGQYEYDVILSTLTVPPVSTPFSSSPRTKYQRLI